MNVVLTYNEISDFIMKEFKIRPKFTSVDEKTFEVSYSPGMFMPNISVKFHIEAIRKDIICLTLHSRRALLKLHSILYSHGRFT